MGADTVVVVVVLLRFTIPLFIPKYPLPAILAALVLDAADQTIFSWVTNDPLPGYQSYDKALDVYYLAIAYIATMRTWRDPVAFQLSRFLYLYRLVGVTLFELIGTRAGCCSCSRTRSSTSSTPTRPCARAGTRCA